MKWVYFGIFYSAHYTLFKIGIFFEYDGQLSEDYRYLGLVTSILSFITYFYMAIFDPKDDMTEREQKLAALPDVYRANLASDREVDVGFFQKLRQFLWPTSDFDIGQTL